jgi:uncharacterized protein DUF4149
LRASNLLTLFDSVYLAALSTWIGGAFFFTFGVAPILSKIVGAESGLKLVRAILPRYYLAGAISGAVALPAFVAGPLCYREYRGAMVGVQALAIIFGILLMLYGANSLAPAIGQAPGAGTSSAGRLEQLQRRAAGLNLVVVLIGLLLLVSFASRPAPKTTGIVEMTPQERARYDVAINRVIADVEARYGLRPPRALAPGETTGPDPLIDQETVREIDSYYARKRLRDQARAGR